MKLAFAVFVCLVGLALALGVGDAEAGKGEKGEGYAKVEVKGKIQTGIVAIGGETTGATIQTKDVTLELDFGKNDKLRDMAEKLDGKVGIVTGALTIRKGVTRGPRVVVMVETLKAAE